MVKKDNLIRQLLSIIENKERISQLVNKHIASALFFSELVEADREIMILRFKEIAATQEKHLVMLKGIKKEAEKGAFDVY